MNSRLQSLPEDGDLVAAAVEANACELLLLMGRAGGGEEYSDEMIHWIAGGSPVDYHNAVVRADLVAGHEDRAIDGFIAALQRHQVPGTWHLGAQAMPNDLEDRLLAKGFRYSGADISMAIDLAQLAPVPELPGIIIREVQQDADLQAWEDALAVDFGEGRKEAQWVAQIWRELGYGAESAWRHYVAWREGIAAATCTLYLGKETAGVYFVATIPQARRQGIGGAITLAALHEARRSAYGVGVLGSSQMGESVYWHLGFRPYGRVRIYEYSSFNR